MFFVKPARALAARITAALRRLKAPPSRTLPKPVYDLNVLTQHRDKKPRRKRALLSYVVEPLRLSTDDPRFLRHIQNFRVREMVGALNRLGFVVDVVDWRDTRFRPRRPYDCFIGLGGVNYEKIATYLPRSSTRLYFSTGCYWRFNNEQELRRVAELERRRNVSYAPERLVRHGEDGALYLADGIIAVGNEFVRDTYQNFSHKVYLINNTVLFDDRYEHHKHKKDFENGKKHFLYYAGKGCVHKGLDLLLEVFGKLSTEHLWICCPIKARKARFIEVYGDMLHHRHNIHLVGYIQPRSTTYYELVDRCNYVILPSCAEAGVQSVLECMHQGLIPAVTKACGLDVDGIGALIEPDTIDELYDVVRRLASLPAHRCRALSAKARAVTVTNHSEAVFRKQFADALRRFLD